MLEGWTLKQILWSLRKAQLPISNNWSVLDIGSGSNPHPAADVLLEKYIDQAHRYRPLVADRPTVLGDACRMPFRDKAFDFAIASHVLEHISEPAAFLNELQRVARAGYIETPNALFERLVPYDVHLLEIVNINEMLIIHKKQSAKPDRFLNELSLTVASPKWRRFFYGNPELFHVRYLWKDNIRFKILNPEISLDWFKGPDIHEIINNEIAARPSIKNLRSLGLSMLRWWYQIRKKRKIDLIEFLACPDCHGELAYNTEFLFCSSCEVYYSTQPLVDFNNPVRGYNQ
ncbi:MAG: methyltransferase domain-containing protein [Nitrospirae bacterium]|nr:methyltransferase domain-containing protein [Nitrospirota bacterium]